ncbi:MAG: Deoxyribodipyrimidine photolyase [uncultured Sphingomonadaceae bacterium]|uniref:Deoxyribodipyrimidine photolyase n=1 Tax=uncultured Sphingomonadaceae bacterium TaxID=169976 RepID=A0A6J4TMM8_9SPHN|nr:MAG: Deoxyribodipyrimidine photolyase [uncultured Sphingomonadaceae bacterium]
MDQDLPHALATWTEAPRARVIGDAPLRADGRYVLCWLQQALRARDNPVIDAAIRLGNELSLPVLVYHGLREDYPFASARLHRFILGGSRDVAKGCLARGLACIQYVDRAAKREKGLVYRLAAEAAAVVLEDQPAFVAQWQSERVAAKARVRVFAVNAACVVPPMALETGIGTTSAFRRRHEKVREQWYAWHEEEPAVAPYDGPLPYEPDDWSASTDAELDALVASLDIDHVVDAPAMFPATRDEVLARLRRLTEEVLPAYAEARGNASRPEGASALSPYLHFGLVGPREVVAAVQAADAPADSKAKYVDELLTWREWFHYKARTLRVPEAWSRLPARAHKALGEHASDPRPKLETLGALLHGETRDETWNACQKQYVLDGWMHNNLRMYWVKALIAMTPDPQTGWATACYLNDRLSLDGRDPATYGNLAWGFGDAAPGYRNLPIYGHVATKSDRSIRERPGGPEWLARAAARPVPRMSVPDAAPVDPYLSERVPI